MCVAGGGGSGAAGDAPRVAKPTRALPGVDLLAEAEELKAKELAEEADRKRAAVALQNKIELAIARTRSGSSHSADTPVSVGH